MEFNKVQTFNLMTTQTGRDLQIVVRRIEKESYQKFPQSL